MPLQKRQPGNKSTKRRQIIWRAYLRKWDGSTESANERRVFRHGKEEPEIPNLRKPGKARNRPYKNLPSYKELREINWKKRYSGSYYYSDPFPYSRPKPEPKKWRQCLYCKNPVCEPIEVCIGCTRELRKL